MKIIFSRKGFDSGSGFGASPIIDGRTCSLPIPEKGQSPHRYCDLGLGELAHKMSGGIVHHDEHCHYDPMFGNSWCWFGQSGPAQSHLLNQGVSEGDVFLFFGLYADEITGQLHHRIFGFLRVAGLGLTGAVRSHELWREPEHPHPHFNSSYTQPNNSIWFGPGASNAPAVQGLRLTARDACNRPSLWQLPKWMAPGTLSYHSADWRWQTGNRLQSVGRGQEFVCDIGNRDAPLSWLEARIAEIEGA